MFRVMKPLPGGSGASRRSTRGHGSDPGAEHPHLSVVRPDRTPCPPPRRGMWHDDPIHDPVRYTTLEDWPGDEEFEPLIAGTVAAGDLALAAQLEADRAFCAAARARLSTPLSFRRDSTA